MIHSVRVDVYNESSTKRHGFTMEFTMSFRNTIHNVILAVIGNRLLKNASNCSPWNERKREKENAATNALTDKR